MTIEGHHTDAAADVAGAIEDLLSLLAEHQPKARLGSDLLFPPKLRFPG